MKVLVAFIATWIYVQLYKTDTIINMESYHKTQLHVSCKIAI